MYWIGVIATILLLVGSFFALCYALDADEFLPLFVVKYKNREFLKFYYAAKQAEKEGANHDRD